MTATRDKFLQYFHWSYLVLSAVSIIAASHFGVDKERIEFIIMPGLLMLYVVLVWIRSVRRGGRELTPIRSFFLDNLLASKSGEELRFNTEIAVIGEYKSAMKFCKDLEGTFRSQLREEDKARLKFRSIACDQSESAKAILSTDLLNTTALIVIRKEGMDESRAYKDINSWAKDRSEIPVLFTQLRANTNRRLPNSLGWFRKLTNTFKSLIRRGPVVERFRWIRKDPKPLPWKLLQRANERGLSWSQQASFNRLIALQTLAFIIFGTGFGYFWLREERIGFGDSMMKTYDAMETRIEYQDSKEKNDRLNALAAKDNSGSPIVSNEKDTKGTLNVSYFFRHDGMPNVYATTERRPEQDDFPANSSSVIGCAFSSPNHFAKWDKEDSRVLVWDFESGKPEDRGCKMSPRPNDPISSIVCASYNSWEQDSALTVGICLFAGDGGRISISKDVEGILKRRASDFYDWALPRIRSHKLIPLKVRRLYQTSG